MYLGIFFTLLEFAFELNVAPKVFLKYCKQTQAVRDLLQKYSWTELLKVTKAEKKTATLSKICNKCSKKLEKKIKVISGKIIIMFTNYNVY